MRAPLMLRPKKISTPKILHKNPYSKILHYKAEFTNFAKHYYVTYFGPRVGVVVVKDGRALLVRQYRFLINNESLEIPGGAVDNNESPEEAARRELFEETGIKCNEFNELVTYYPGLDNVQNRTTVFLCEDFEVAKTFIPNEQEALGYTWMPIKKCVEEITTGKQLDALTIIGIMTYYATLRR